jgi:4-amino-4-deoxy-L-arabinose transferase-like glycosyltransferase
MSTFQKKRDSSIPLPVVLAMAFVLIFCSIFNSLVFERVPHVHDEIAYLFQAKIFQSGRLFASSPCAREFFDFPHIINNGRWYSIYPPGFPFLLLIGLLLRAPWLINPLLAALAIGLFYFLGKEFYDRPSGVLAALLGAGSIWLLLMSSTMMSHPASMFFNTLFLLFIFRSTKVPNILNGLLAGFSLGMAFLIRPYNGFFFALPFLIYYAVWLLKDMRSRLKNGVAMVVSASALVGILFAYNFLTNGHPLKMGYVALYGKAYTVVFGRAATLDYDYTPFFGSQQIFDNIKALNSDLFGWPLSSFLALIPLVWLAVRSREERQKAFLLMSSFLSLLVGFYFFWGAFVFIGPRMFFDSVPIFVLLSARGARGLPSLLASKFAKLRLQTARKGIGVALILFAAYAFFVRFPDWLWPQGAGWYYDRYDHNFAGSTGRLQESLGRLGLRNALVVLKFLHSPMSGFPTGQWGSGFLHDDPGLRGEIIYAEDRGSQNIELFPCVPEREFYFYLGTLEKGMLIPMRKEGEKLIYGHPVSTEAKCLKCVEIINSPKKFFKLYSPEFEEFIDQLVSEKDYLKIDVPYLFNLGMKLRKDGNTERAAFCLEAGLQIENDPESRYRLLNNLAACYLQMRRMEDAQKIQTAVSKASFNYSERDMYNLFPERGF